MIEVGQIFSLAHLCMSQPLYRELFRTAGPGKCPEFLMHVAVSMLRLTLYPDVLRHPTCEQGVWRLGSGALHRAYLALDRLLRKGLHDNMNTLITVHTPLKPGIRFFTCRTKSSAVKRETCGLASHQRPNAEGTEARAGHVRSSRALCRLA